MVRMEICVHTILSPGVGHKVGLELGQVHVEGSIKPEGGGDGGDDLTDESVEVRVGGPLYVQVPPADVVDGLVVHHEGTVSVVEGGVGGEDGIVGLHHSYKPHFSGGQLLAQSNLWILSVRGRW